MPNKISTISPALPILTKSVRAEAARPPLPDPTIVDLRTPSWPPQSTKFDHVLTGLHRGYPTKFQSHRSDGFPRKVAHADRLAPLYPPRPPTALRTPPINSYEQKFGKELN